MIHNVSPNSPTQLLEQNSNLGRNDVVIENDIQLPRVSSISYSTSIMRKPKNHLSSNTGAKKKQIQAKPKSKKEMEIERVRAEILQGYLVLVILRGLPGSGKTQLAKYLASSTVPGDYRTFVYSTDDYFISGGTYKHNPALLPEAHAWNQRRVSEAAQLGIFYHLI